MSRTTSITLVIAVVALAGCAAGFGVGDGTTDTAPPAGGDPGPSDRQDDGQPLGDDTLELHHLDVGQADSTVIVTPSGETILIDTGDWRQDGAAVIDALEAEGIDRIDHLVATHGHADHVGGHAAVIDHFETSGDGVGAAYDSGVPHTSATYEDYLDAIERHDVDLFVVEAGDRLPVGDDRVSARVLNPPADEATDDLHANGVSLLVEYGDFDYLTTGDAESDAEARMVEEWGDALDADVYQAGHHGSSTSSSASFLDAVDPEIAVISSDVDSQYGHPHDEVLEELADRGIETYWTGVHGAVVVRTDGTTVDVEPTEAFTPDAADLLDEKPPDDVAASTLVGVVDVVPAPTPG